METKIIDEFIELVSFSAIKVFIGFFMGVSNEIKITNNNPRALNIRSESFERI